MAWAYQSGHPAAEEEGKEGRATEAVPSLAASAATGKLITGDFGPPPTQQESPDSQQANSPTPRPEPATAKPADQSSGSSATCTRRLHPSAPADNKCLGYSPSPAPTAPAAPAVAVSITRSPSTRGKCGNRTTNAETSTTFRLLTWNSHGLQGTKLLALSSMVQRTKADIIVATEAELDTTDRPTIPEYDTFLTTVGCQ